MKHSDMSLQDLLLLDPVDIEIWIRNNTRARAFDWIILAEIAGQEAMSANLEVAKVWARISLFSREIVAENATDRAIRRLQEVRSMRLRAELISKFRDSVPDDSLFDHEELFAWFIVRYQGQLDAVAADAHMWTELPIERIRELRNIKEELNILRITGDSVPSVPDEVRNWLALWGILP